MRKLISGVIWLIAFTLCAQTYTREDYIEKYAGYAVTEMKKYGIPASITLAQGILESGAGNSYLAREANNHFGIKCHDWTGPSVRRDDDARNECFRKYDDPLDSFEDHSKFLVTRERYADLFKLKITDYKGWAHGLKKAGYATDPRYAERLITIIEENELFLFDRGVDVQFTIDEVVSTKNRKKTSPVDNFVIDAYISHQVYSNNKVDYVKAKPGDSFENIAQEFDLHAWELPRYNDWGDKPYMTAGQIIYIQPKRTKSHSHEFHVVKEGETMWEISQMYGIKLKYLYKKNRMEEGTQPVQGQKLYLKKTKPRD